MFENTNMSQNWACSRCGQFAYYDGRCGDGPVLLCGCDEIGPVMEDTRGGSLTRVAMNDAKPIPVSQNYKPPKN